MQMPSCKNTVLALLLMMVALPATADNSTVGTMQPVTPSSAETKPSITLTQISDQSINTQKLIEKLRPLVTQPVEFEELNDKLDPTRKQLLSLQIQTNNTINDRKSSIDQIRSSQSQWRFIEDQLTRDQQKIRDRGTELENALAQLANEEKNWQQISAITKVSPELNYDGSSTRTATDNISSLRKQLSVPLQEAITLEKEWQDLLEICEDVQVSLKNDESYLRNNLLTNIQSPIWEMSADDFDIHQGTEQFIRVQTKLINHYGLRYLYRVCLIILGTAGIIFFLRRLHQYNRKSQQDRMGISLSLPLLERPVSTIIAFGVSIALVLLPYPPQLLKSVLSLLLFIPVTRLGMSRLPKTIRPLAWLVSLFFIINSLSVLTVFIPALQRLWILISAAIGFGSCVHALLHLSPSDERRPTLWKLLRASIWLAMFAALAAVIGGIFGAITLSQFLITGVAYSAYAGLCLVVLAGILNDLAVAAIYMPASETSHLISSNRSLLVQYITRMTATVCSLFWIYFTLSQFALWDETVNFFQQLLAQSFQAGSISLSVGDVISVSLTIWLSFKISRLLRFILVEDIAPRTNMARGVPEAIATLTQYCIVLIGFIVAISMAGIDVSKLTIMAGALGVGIGIGLQDVVNNFTSGLIMLFEQNIKLADIIQCGNVNGRVTHIGMRCSVVRTFDGAEVIVPNGQLVSAQVINWTHSDQVRRITITIGAAYNTDPQKVIDTLLTVAKNDDDILETPPPTAFFLRFGPSSMDFELRAWVDNGEFINEVNSRLCVAIANAFTEAGINIPFPQQDVYIRNMPPPSS